MIEIRTWLKDETWHAFAQLADDRGTTVAVLLATLADQVLAPARKQRSKRVEADRPRREYRRWTQLDTDLALELHDAGLSDSKIAARLDRRQSIVSKKLRDRGRLAHFEAPPNRRSE